MTLLMRDRENQKIGKEIGKIFGAISVYRDLRLSEEEIIMRLRAKFDLTEEQARTYLKEAEWFSLMIHRRDISVFCLN